MDADPLGAPVLLPNCADSSAKGVDMTWREGMEYGKASQGGEMALS
jgi:hypothetical protein